VVRAGTEVTLLPPDDVLVRVGERGITREALNMRTRQITLKRRQKPTAEEMATLVDRLVEQTLFAEEARDQGLDQEEVVKILIADTVDKLLANLYVRGHVLPAVQVSETEVVSYYTTHQHSWRQPETVRARHILLRVAPRATAEAVQAVEVLALGIRQRLLSGEDFAILAKSCSEDTGTKNKGGDLGFFTRKGKVAAISETAFGLKVGEISPPVRSSVGYHILQTMEHRSPGVKPLEAVRGKIRAFLLREKQTTAARTERRRLEKKYNLYVHEALRLKGGHDAP
nr:peptidylprolyl isomerase [Desulfobacterales bacterium]